jgi:hypothetical protein
MRTLTKISSVSSLCLLGLTSIPLLAADLGQVIVETSLGRNTYPCIKYEGKLFMALEGVANLLQGGRPTLEPGLSLRGRELRAVPASDGSEKAKVELFLGAPHLRLNPKLASAGKSALITSNVVEINGHKWVPVDDVAKATGAQVQSDSRRFEEIKVTNIKVPGQCADCALVTVTR